MIHLSCGVPPMGRTRCHRYLCRAALLCFALLYQGCTNTPVAPDQASGREPAVKAASPEELEQYSRAIVALENGDPAAAEKLLRDMADRYPGTLPVQLNLAIAMYQQQKLIDVKTLVEALKPLHNDNADVHHLRGLVALGNEDYSVAESAFHQALKLENKHALAHYNLALLYDLYLQDIRQAAFHYERYLQLRPEDTETAAWAAQLKRSLVEQ